MNYNELGKIVAHEINQIFIKYKLVISKAEYVECYIDRAIL